MYALTLSICKLNLQFQMNFNAEQCNSKWKNLLRAYKKFTDNSKKTGAATISKPTFYEEIHALVHDSHVVNPTNIYDSSASKVLKILY